MSNSIRKIFLLIIMLVIVVSATVVAGNLNVKEVKVIFSDGSTTTLTTINHKSKEEILKENNIILLENEEIRNNEDSNIYIDKKETNTKIINTKVISSLTKEELDQNYSSIVEKIEVEQIEIPFSTVTRQVEDPNNATSMVVQIGENGIKEITYKVLYKGEEIIEKTQIEEKVVKQPKDKIIQLTPKVTSRSLARDYTPETNSNVSGLSAREAFDKITAEKGLSQAQKDQWAYIINKESSWNHTNVNRSSGAYGLPQALPGSKMASAGSDWRTNPYTQLKWMYNYMTSRYGSVSGAYNFWIKNKWY